MVSSFRLLPTALLTLVLASPLFAAPTSENNLFRSITALAARKPEPPICCLKLLQPLDDREDEILLSFEEWKSKQIQLEKSKGRDGTDRSTQTHPGSGGGKSNGSENIGEAGSTGNIEDLPPQDEVPRLQPPEVEAVSPHFRVPIQGRFNYANSDCSARVHMSHRSAKSSSAILSSKRDRYMLSPCVSPNREPHFVVVELCDDIAIDTVQLANFEFFSGVFKDFKVSVTKTDFTKPAEEWTDAGTYRAKNVRGVQSFPLPKTLRDFYRYIRIDFLSHYGSEFYCPVSLLRVYGLTHLEQWKWDEWAVQSSPGIVQAAAESLSPSPSHEESIPEAATASVIKHVEDGRNTSSEGKTDTASHTDQSAGPSSTPAETTPVVTPISILVETPANTGVQAKEIPLITGTDAAPIPQISKIMSSATDVKVHSTEVGASPSMTTVLTTPPTTAVVQSSPKASNPTLDNTSITPYTTAHSKVYTTAIVSSTATPIIISGAASSVGPPTTGGESIYRTIMNRITALENNHTLYALYLGEQMDGVREKLRRLGEDVGRLEGIGRGQAQAYQRTLQHWEKQQLEMQGNYRELLNKVEHLSGEIVLEKRLGIAQLCLLLAVLVFMGLTRGSREHVQLGRRSNYALMRDWSRRHLRLSGEWANKLVRSRTRSAESAITDIIQPSQRSSLDYDHQQSPENSRSARSAPRSSRDNEERDASPSLSKVVFPGKSSPQRRPLGITDINSRQERHHQQHIVFPVGHEHRIQSRSRTPSRRSKGQNSSYSQNQAPPFTPTHFGHHTASYSTGYARPRIQRSNSHGAGPHGAITSTGHRSSKRWGRVAHLHDMRSVEHEWKAKKELGKGKGTHNVSSTDEVDVFMASTESRHALGLHPTGRVNGPGLATGPSFPPSSGVVEGELDGDQWVDTDTEADADDADEDTWDTLKYHMQSTLPKMGLSGGKEH